MWQPWRLLRSPLSPGVPLEGTDTVQGLRILERQRLTEALLQPAAGAGGATAAATSGGWQRRFQRYRGPFIEQLSMADLKRDPKSWAVFWKGSETGQLAQVRGVAQAPAAGQRRWRQAPAQLLLPMLLLRVLRTDPMWHAFSLCAGLQPARLAGRAARAD